MATTAPKTLHLLHENHSLGYITGLSFSSASNPSIPACHLFAGLPYALPPVGPYRFRRPRSLPTCYRYGTENNPGVFIGGAGVCPQPTLNGGVRDGEEDCLQVNVWVPGGEAPEGGWPIFFFIHGGFLQYGTPNSVSAVELLGETACGCIIVCPAYRLNVFGFLASTELEDESGSAGNYGFWDQRLALEWTRRFAAYFGGDSTRITVGGYSAGAHSAFHQLTHDLSLPRKDRIIRRVVFFSNGPGMQPKSLPQAQHQFDALLTSLSIPLTISSAEKLSRLRTQSSRTLLQAAAKLDLHEFRATTDGAFIFKDEFADIDSGIFAQRLREGNVQILIGECEAEGALYGRWRSPTVNTFAAMRHRLLADYPPAPLDAALALSCPQTSPDGQRKLPTLASCRAKSWTEAFGLVYADLQVHASERGFFAALERHGAGHLVKRYRIEYRCKCVDAAFPLAYGVTHATDMAIWFWGNGMKVKAVKGEREEIVGLIDDEKRALEVWCRPFWSFLRGETVEWGTDGIRGVRRLKADISIDVWKDNDWDRGVQVWTATRAAAVAAEKSRGARL